MKLNTKLNCETIISEFEGKEEKEILILYEIFGKEICRRFDFDYSKLLEMMLQREQNRKKTN